MMVPLDNNRFRFLITSGHFNRCPDCILRGETERGILLNFSVELDGDTKMSECQWCGEEWRSVVKARQTISSILYRGRPINIAKEIEVIRLP
jgi:hypothetical protein